AIFSGVPPPETAACGIPLSCDRAHDVFHQSLGRWLASQGFQRAFQCLDLTARQLLGSAQLLLGFLSVSNIDDKTAQLFCWSRDYPVSPTASREPVFGAVRPHDPKLRFPIVCALDRPA